jgi:hypothetical protein
MLVRILNFESDYDFGIKGLRIPGCKVFSRIKKQTIHAGFKGVARQQICDSAIGVGYAAADKFPVAVGFTLEYHRNAGRRTAA